MKKYSISNYLCWYCLITLLGVRTYAATNSIGPHALPDTLSQEASISWLTKGFSTKEVYMAFGHTAVRVQDPTQALDLVFNYGVFNFNTPNFYLNYLLGKLYYQVEINHYQYALTQAIAEETNLKAQELALTHAQRNQFYTTLLHDAAPENKVYRYDYFKVNCSNRVVQSLQQSLGENLILNYQSLPPTQTYRSLMNQTLRFFPFEYLGINTLLGSRLDQPLNTKDYLFLPKYVHEVFNHSQINTPQGPQALIKKNTTLLTSPTQTMPFNYLTLIMWSIALSTLLISYQKKPPPYMRKLQQGCDTFLLGSTGLLGCLLVFMWVGTDHYSEMNYNLLWAMPTHLLASVWSIMGRNKPLRYYYTALLGVNLLLFVSWYWLPQRIPNELLPLLLAIVLRALIHTFKRNTPSPKPLVNHINGTSSI